MGARLDRPGTELRDFQTAKLEKADIGWTTLGLPEGRRGGVESYRSPHIRERFYRADALVTVAMRLEPASEATDLDAVEAALDTPVRPLFIGRKSCLPSTPVKAGRIDTLNTLDALLRWPLVDTMTSGSPIKVIVPVREVTAPGSPRLIRVADRRNWISGVHAGESELCVIAIDRAQFRSVDERAEARP